MSKKCSCPFDTPEGPDKIKMENGWTVTYCWQCRGMVSSVMYAAGDGEHK